MNAQRYASSLIAALAVALVRVASADSAEAPTAPPHSDRSSYVSMRDGVRIALSLWFPGGREPENPAPTLLIQTRYGRAGVFGDGESRGYQPFVDAGYVVAIIDTRGSTASFGPRDVDIGPDEVRDMDEVIAHLASRPWSNGVVYVTGLSYMADTADIASSRPASAMKGGIIRETDFDVWTHLFFPGGAKNDWFLTSWGDATHRMDLGVSMDPALNLDCRARAADCPKLWPVLQAVDNDKDFTSPISASAPCPCSTGAAGWTAARPRQRWRATAPPPRCRWRSGSRPTTTRTMWAPLVARSRWPNARLNTRRSSGPALCG
jgi:predicted acyl esterase